MSLTASDSHELSLQRLLLGFMKFAFDQGQTNFPPFENTLWHDFLYLLKSDFETKFPELECVGTFDWNGLRPKCRNFNSEMFLGLRYKCYSQTLGGRVFLNPEIKAHTENFFEKYYPELAEKMLVLAHQIPEFFSTQS